MFSILVALIGCAVQLAVVATHPEPGDDDPDLVHKPSYCSLVSWRSVIRIALVSSVLGWFVARSALPVSPVWAVWAGFGLVWVWVDARTTWLPPRCTRLTWGAMVLAVLTSADGRDRLAAMTLGAAGAAVIFWVLWRLSRSLGFGDVHLAAMVGALGASGGLAGWSTALLAGTVLAAAWGVVVMVWRRRRPHPLGSVFAYGPGLWAGAWATILCS